MLRSTALLLRHGLGRPDDAAALEHAVDDALVQSPMPDLGGSATTTRARRRGLARARAFAYPLTIMPGATDLQRLCFALFGFAFTG